MLKLAPERQTILDFNEARDDGVAVASLDHMQCICKSFVPNSQQITMPAAQHSNCYRLDAFPDAEPTVSKH